MESTWRRFLASAVAIVGAALVAGSPAHLPVPVRAAGAGPYELRHVSNSGGLIASEDANTAIAGALRAACITGTDATDTMNPGDISFSILGGDHANTAGSQVFHNGSAGPAFGGFPVGTLCFRWTSTSPGEQTISARFNPGGNPALSQQVSWDTNGDGNGTGSSFGPLVQQWSLFDHTVLTLGQDPTVDIVTDSRVTVPVQFNVADGTFVMTAGTTFTLTEWVFGKHTGSNGRVVQLIDGVRLRARLTTSCGYFVGPGLLAPPNAVSRDVTGVSADGRFDLDPPDGLPDDIKISVLGDQGCNLSSVIHLELSALASNGTTVLGIETADLVFQLAGSPVSAPQVAWAGETVTIEYGFATSGTCKDAAGTVDFLRSEKQPGNFLPGEGIVLNGPGHATTLFGVDCFAAVQYHSEDPGEVDVVVTLSTNPFSKVVFPIFFLNIEDVTLEASEESVVSSLADLTATVRGWFVGTNPSTRPAETKPDGRQLPAYRWILPTDWLVLRGNPDLRPGWPETPELPPVRVTFGMKNEAVVNSYPLKIFTGDLGWFRPEDGFEFDYNVNPVTHLPSTLGSAQRPRLLSDLTGTDGVARIHTFGDFNLTFEGCAANVLTGNPLCAPDDIVGRSNYVATAMYYPLPGKWVPVGSNVATTRWTWAGYKRVTVVDTAAEDAKYVVLHLKDRDGFCDALSFNNMLGVPVDFDIQTQAGRIIATGGSYSVVNAESTHATVTTFDTQDEAGLPMNVAITQPMEAPDECQAWVQVTNSFLTPVVVRITIPGPPAAVPGPLRITAFQCGAEGTVTIKNTGSAPFPLAGFTLRSDGDVLLAPEQYLPLDGIIHPGESFTYPGKLWFATQGDTPIFRTDPALPMDYVRIVWNEFEISRATCDGSIFNFPIPAPLPPDPEGATVFEVTLNFGAPTVIPLQAGWNLVTVDRNRTLEAVLRGNEDNIDAIYNWDSRHGVWMQYISRAPAAVNTLDRFEGGKAYWLSIKRAFTLTVTR